MEATMLNIISIIIITIITSIITAILTSWLHLKSATKQLITITSDALKHVIDINKESRIRLDEMDKSYQNFTHNNKKKKEKEMDEDE
jgi:hypothetical protein